MERQERGSVLKPVGAQEGERPTAGLHHDADILMLVGKSVDPGCLARIDAAAKEIDDLGAAAGAQEIAVKKHRLIQELETGFLARLAPRHRERGLTRVIDDPGDDLDLPGRKTGEVCGQAELLDEHHLVAIGIIKQDADGAATFEDLARNDRTPTAGKEPMAQMIPIDAEEPLVGGFLRENLDRLGRG